MEYTLRFNFELTTLKRNEEDIFLPLVAKFARDRLIIPNCLRE